MVKERLLEKLSHMSDKTTFTYTSNSAKMFDANLDTLKMAFVFADVGREIFNSTFPIEKDSWAVIALTLRSLMNSAVSCLEHFYSEFLIEKLGIPNIKTKDDLKKYIDASGLCYGDKRLNTISFQNLKEVSHYYKVLISVDLYQYKDIKIIDEIMDFRHIDTHNFGLLDDKFKRKNQELMRKQPDGVGHLVTATSFLVDLFILKHFVSFIDSH